MNATIRNYGTAEIIRTATAEEAAEYVRIVSGYGPTAREIGAVAGHQIAADLPSVVYMDGVEIPAIGDDAE
jgi:hypothetical protein